jgi:hypothetical protein
MWVHRAADAEWAASNEVPPVIFDKRAPVAQIPIEIAVSFNTVSANQSSNLSNNPYIFSLS